VGPGKVLDDMEKRNNCPVPGLELRLIGRPAPSQSLYLLRCPGFQRYYKYSNGVTEFRAGQRTQRQAVNKIKLVKPHIKPMSWRVL
jgi:hypothetical protein